MTIWAIADLHLSPTDPETGLPRKPMDIFGQDWADHTRRLEQAWHEVVQPTDTIILAGDLDWSVHLDEAQETLERLAWWPGHKILVRGNHDYWWSSKTTSRVRRAAPASISLLHNNAFEAENVAIAGTKGSPVPGSIEWTEHDAKILNREVQRLETSLQAAPDGRAKIVALHYPPFYRGHEDSPYRDVLERFGVSACVYGHLHGDAAQSGPVGTIGGIAYRLVAGDALGFRPVAVARAGRLLLTEVA